jgi:fructose-1,6-bisphosphatase/inositol monophosphatase family enzyme
MTPQPPQEEFLAFAEKLTDASRETLISAAGRTPGVDVKAGASFVTYTDKAVEKKLRETIAAAFPGHGIMGEEFPNTNVAAEFVWVLGPIDGTLIAVAWNDGPFIGVIDHPATSDRWASVAHLFAKRNGKTVSVKSCSNLSRAFVTCSSPDFMSDDEGARFAKLRKQVPYVKYDGSCFFYGALTSGRTDLAVDNGLEPFDVYASAAVIQGAGGFMTDWGGQDISLEWSGKVLAAGDKRCLQTAIATLAES